MKNQKTGLKSDFPFSEIEVSYAILKQWEETQMQFQLIDVREEYERIRNNRGGIHIPMREIMESLEKIEKNCPVVLYCEAGARSLTAAKFLRKELQREDIFSLNPRKDP